MYPIGKGIIIYLLFAPFASLNLLVGERKQTTHCVRVPIVVNESVQSKEQRSEVMVKVSCNSDECVTRTHVIHDVRP